MNEFDSVENVQDQRKRKEQKARKYIASFVRKLIYFHVYKFR